MWRRVCVEEGVKGGVSVGRSVCGEGCQEEGLGRSVCEEEGLERVFGEEGL